MGYEIERELPGFRWYALSTRSRQEKTVASMLESLRVQYFLPCSSEVRQWSERRQRVRVPLFQGYLFVHSNLARDRTLEILRAPGAARFVGNNSGPLPIPDAQIDRIRQVINCGIECPVEPQHGEGDRVCIVRGPLSGIEGTLVRTSSTIRMLIAIEIIHQALAVNVSTRDIEIVSRNAERPPEIPWPYSLDHAEGIEAQSK